MRGRRGIRTRPRMQSSSKRPFRLYAKRYRPWRTLSGADAFQVHRFRSLRGSILRHITRPALERAALVQFIHVAGNSVGLVPQVILDCLRELGMRKPVCRTRGDRQEAARQFVLATGAAFKSLDAVRNAELDGLVVAGFKMQSGM